MARASSQWQQPGVNETMGRGAAFHEPLQTQKKNLDEPQKTKGLKSEAFSLQPPDAFG